MRIVALKSEACVGFSPLNRIFIASQVQKWEVKEKGAFDAMNCRQDLS